MAEKRIPDITSVTETKFVGAKNENIQIVPEKTDIIQIKKKILRVVESLLEEKVTAENLIESCRMLTKNDYVDVVEERNITDLCGYPLCPNHVQIPSQQFHIVSQVNKVYDINERKRFCSNMCYKASCYLKRQLSETTVWFREDLVDLTLLSDDDNSGSIGEPITLCQEKFFETEAKLKSEESVWFTKEDKTLISDDLGKCADAFKNLEVKEKRLYAGNVDGKEKWFSCDSTKNIRPSTFHENPELKTYDFCRELNDIESDHSDDDYFPSDEQNISEKLMPLPLVRKVKLPILIKPDNKFIVSLPPVISNPLSLCMIQDILRGWITTDTLRFLSCEVKGNNISQSAQSDIHHLHVKKHTSNVIEDHNTWTTTYGVENTAPKLQNVANNNKVTVSEQTELVKTTNLPTEMINNYFQNEDLFQEKRNQPHVVKFKTGRKGGVKLIKNKASEPVIGYTPSLDTKEKNHLENSSYVTDNSILPKIDSLSQNAMRQQVVCAKLKNAFSDILPLIGLHVKVLGDIILNLVSTFSLTSSNVMYKPNEWKFLAIVLFRAIMKSNVMKDKILEQFTEDTFSLLLKKTAVCEHLSVQDIDKTNELFNCNMQLEKIK